MRFYRNYYQTYVERDIRQLIHLRHAVAFEHFLKLLAGRIGQVVNVADISNALGMSDPTLTEWLSILEASFILFRLQPYFENFGKRITKKPKIFFTDPGLASYLLGITKPEEIAVGSFLGNLFENLVILEIMKTRLNLGQDPNLYFFRENYGIEKDLLLTGFQKIFPVEIKASRTFSPDFCMNLQKIQKLHENMGPGAVVYAGEQEMEFKKVKIVNFRNAGSLVEESFS
ncbi:MAG: DUF4143 domain-containing protein [Acidobacteria bacterium]|nr:DUF4143 domain-containing protein [Acidobacteriota bacterium]